VLQLPSTHLLGQNFAKPFDVKYLNEKGEHEYCHQTCYGPAISRIYAAIFSIHGDDTGIIMPYELAPVQAVVFPVSDKSEKYAKEIFETMRAAGIRAEFDLESGKIDFFQVKIVVDDSIVWIPKEDEEGPAVDFRSCGREG